MTPPALLIMPFCLNGEIEIFSSIQFSILTVHLSTQMYKWDLVNLMLEVALQWTSTTGCYRYRDKLQHYGPLGPIQTSN